MAQYPHDIGRVDPAVQTSAAGEAVLIDPVNHQISEEVGRGVLQYCYRWRTLVPAVPKPSAPSERTPPESHLRWRHAYGKDYGLPEDLAGSTLKFAYERGDQHVLVCGE